MQKEANTSVPEASASNLSITDKHSDKHLESILAFQKKGVNLVIEHIEHSDYREHRALIREINFLVYYTFEVMKDDFYLGDKVFKRGITKIDDYVFSQYRKNPLLADNIKKLITVAFSNRFEDKPHANLLAYYVFIEEVGFEIMLLLKDFYTLLETGQNKSARQYQLNVDKKEDHLKPNEDQTLFEQALSEVFSPLHAQKNILEDILEKEKQQLKQK